jgi:hypothetical protein
VEGLAAKGFLNIAGGLALEPRRVANEATEQE